MTESEAIDRLKYLKNKVDVALMNSKYEKGNWLYDDVQGTADALKMAIKALEKQEQIKQVFTHYPFSGFEMDIFNDCISALSEIKTILKESDKK